MVLIDKPEGWTSYDVVRRLKRVYRGKIGHAGTLDPFATGLLLVLFGQATRASSLFMDLAKEYVATVRLGAVSSTGDPTGTVTETKGVTELPAVLAALDGLRGKIVQRVPMTSAVKVGGERLYAKARRGEEIDTPEREVMVYDLGVLGFDAPRQRLDVVALTGKGTYVRRLAEDLGARLGVGGYAESLRRTKIGTFRVERAVGPDALTVGDVEAGQGVPHCLRLSEALDFLPAARVESAEAALVSNGAKVECECEGLFRIVSGEGLLGVYDGAGGVARARIVFPRPEE